jgi:hypothetical protein
MAHDNPSGLRGRKAKKHEVVASSLCLINRSDKSAHSADATTPKRPRQQFTLGSPNALSQLSLLCETTIRGELHKTKAGRV